MPDLRKIVKARVKSLPAVELVELISVIDKAIFEEVMFVGMAIDGGKYSDDERHDLLEKYLALCDCWSAIDIFATRGGTKYSSPFWFNYAASKLTAKNEFTVRFGIVLLMANFLTPEYIDRVFAALRTVSHEGYYAKIALAWLYAEAALNFYERTLSEVKAQSKWVRNKALQKMTESRRFTGERKAEIRSLKA
jgi:hypothetical protein